MSASVPASVALDQANELRLLRAELSACKKVLREALDQAYEDLGDFDPLPSWVLKAHDLRLRP